MPKNNKAINILGLFLGCLITTTFLHSAEPDTNPITEEMPLSLFDILPVEMQERIFGHSSKSDLDALAETSMYGRGLSARVTRHNRCLKIESTNADQIKPETLERASSIKFNLPDGQTINGIRRILAQVSPDLAEHINNLSIYWQNPNETYVYELLNTLTELSLPKIQYIGLITPMGVYDEFADGLQRQYSWPNIAFYFFEDREDSKKTLFCFCNYLNIDNKRSLIRSSMMKKINVLSFHGEIDESVMNDLANVVSRSLRSISLELNGDDILRAFLRSSLASKQVKFDLSLKNVSFEGALALVAVPRANIKGLNLYKLDSENVGLILQSPNLPSLKRLGIWDTDLTPDAFQAVIRLVNGINLIRLDIERCNLCDDHLIELAQSPGLKSIRELIIRSEDITNEGIEAVTNSKNLNNSIKLNLENTLL